VRAGVDKDTEHNDLHSVTVFSACWSRQRHRTQLSLLRYSVQCVLEYTKTQNTTIFTKTQNTTIFTPLQCSGRAGVDKDTEHNDLHSVTVFRACWSRQRHRTQRSSLRYSVQGVLEYTKTQYTTLFTPLQCSGRAGVDKDRENNDIHSVTVFRACWNRQRHRTQRSSLRYSVQRVLE